MCVERTRTHTQFIRKRYVPLFELHNVSLVISGHQHNYQRGARHGVTYTVVGGAGGTLEWERVEDYGMYEVTANVHHFVEMELRDEGGGREAELRWRAREVGGWFGGGRVIDEFVLRR